MCACPAWMASKSPRRSAAWRGCDHIVQLYQDEQFLTEAVVDYIGTGLQRGEAAIVIATPQHRAGFLERLEPKEGQLRLLDAEEILERFMTNGTPDWKSFHEIVGGAI